VNVKVSAKQRANGRDKRRNAGRRRVNSAWLTSRLTVAHDVLANPTATDQQRRRARCTINRTIATMRALEPIQLMKRGLQVDVASAATRAMAAVNTELAKRARRPRASTVKAALAVATLLSAGARS
jgi:hypothetical protein